MKAVDLQAKGIEAPPPAHTASLGNIALKLLSLMIFDAMALVFIYLLFSDGYWQLATMFVVITVGVNVVFLREDAYPLRWMAPGLAFMLLISVYPIIFTIYIAFTNFGTGHLLPKVQAIEILEQRTYLPEAGITYNYTVFQSEAGEYALWLQPAEGEGFLVTPGARMTVEEAGISAFDEEGVPESVPGYQPVSRRDLVRAIGALGQIQFGEPPNVVQVTSQLGRAAELEQRYVYDEEQDAIIDRQTNTTYFADARQGSFVSEEGQVLIPGYQVEVGTRNFQRFLNNPSFRGPLLRIFLWTFAFALLSVFFAFTLGLTIAIAFGRDMPFRKAIKSLLIIPFAIPSVITVLIWRGLLNPLNGVISNTLADMFNQPVGWPPVFADPFWVKVALLMINVWLAYPYFMLINSGALQAIPQDMYEAAEIDGASWWQQFRNLTLPMLLVGVGPLLIASFTANFNSFNVIFLFNSGGPPMVGTSTPAGHSDILISYV
ncbi:MAG TPA: ABC transporter permease subunit, partial [Anaerolineae bacterium]